MILDDILEAKKKEVLTRKKQYPECALIRSAQEADPALNLASALSSDIGNKYRIIAEIKKASPSRGIICEHFQPVETALQYENNGAVAISVLTDEKFFKGSLQYLRDIKEHKISIPLLRKDFIIDPYQIYEARAFGADAVLLIVAALSDTSRIKEFLALVDELSFSALVEVHSKTELDKALYCGAEIIGINNRDLKTFNTDIKTTLEIIDDIPDDRVVVSESGIKTTGDLKKLSSAGVSAFLIGETFMRDINPGQKLDSFVNNRTT